MNTKNLIISVIFSFMLVSCGLGGNKTSTTGDDKNYPKTEEDAREAKRGKITGEEGITLIGGKFNPNKNLRGESIARGVNAYLWQAALDTISFMPIASVDATGGVIITDWYEDPNKGGEKIKANVLISSDELRASGVKVSLFRSVGGRSASANDALARTLEDKILTRARELKIEDDRF